VVCDNSKDLVTISGNWKKNFIKSLFDQNWDF
jgi:hypothetical protein